MELNPKRVAFKEYYCNPESDTFGNAYQSAKKAGFSEEYAKNIMNQGQEWVSEIIRDMQIINKAEKNLDVLLESEDERIKSDMTKFTLSRLNKRKYSDRTEHTGKDGGDIKVMLTNYGDKDTVSI